MAKTVKGARIRLRRTSEAGQVPTIPPNEDHTTGWKDTDIYIGELFINTSITSPGIWFRETTGVTQIATLDKITNRLSANQIPSVSRVINNAFFTSDNITDIISDGTQYIIIDDSISGMGVTANNTIDLSALETTVVKVVHISLNTNNNGNTLTVYIKGTNITPIITNTANGLRGISLLWDLTRWVILSNNLN